MVVYSVRCFNQQQLVFYMDSFKKAASRPSQQYITLKRSTTSNLQTLANYVKITNARYGHSLKEVLSNVMCAIRSKPTKVLKEATEFKGIG